MNCKVSEVATDFGCIPRDPVGFVEKIYPIGLSFIGGVAVIFLIIGAYMILTSQGNTEQLKNGKVFIYYALGGLILAIFGYVFLSVIAVDILRIPGFN